MFSKLIYTKLLIKKHVMKSTVIYAHQFVYLYSPVCVCVLCKNVQMYLKR